MYVIGQNNHLVHFLGHKQCLFMFVPMTMHVCVCHTHTDTHSQSAYSYTQLMGTRRTGRTTVDKGGQQETRMSRLC